MQKMMKSHRSRIAATSVALVAGGAIGVTMLGSSQASPATESAAAPVEQSAPAPTSRVWSPEITTWKTESSASRAAATSTLDALVAKHSLAIDATPSDVRTIASPTGAKAWTVFAKGKETCFTARSEVLICGGGAGNISALTRGYVAGWSTPTPQEEATGSGEYVVDGLAVDGVTDIAAVDLSTREVITRTAPKASAFELTIPATAGKIALRVTGANGLTSTSPIN